MSVTTIEKRIYGQIELVLLHVLEGIRDKTDMEGCEMPNQGSHIRQ